MRRGIGLRGYAQQDPLNEFKKEAFSPLRGAPRAHPPPGRHDDLPGHRHPDAATGCPGGPARVRPLAAGANAVRNAGPAAGRRRRSRRGRGRPGACPRGPARGTVESLGDEAVGGPAARLGRQPGVAGGGAPKPGFRPGRPADRPQRRLLVRIGPEVQEVPRSLTATARLRDLLLLVARRAGPRAQRARGLTPRSGSGSRASRDDHPSSGAIVVLGAAQFDGRPVAGLRRPARLGRRRSTTGARAKLVVMTGGKAEGDRTTEAEAGRDYAIARGVPAARSSSRTGAGPPSSRSTARRRSSRAHGVHDAVFVSDPTHMLRVLRMATDLGIVAWGSPTPTSRIETDTGPQDRRHDPRTRRTGPVLLRARRTVGGTGLRADRCRRFRRLPLLACRI